MRFQGQLNERRPRAQGLDGWIGIRVHPEGGRLSPPPERRGTGVRAGGAQRGLAHRPRPSPWVFTRCGCARAPGGGRGGCGRLGQRPLRHFLPSRSQGLLGAASSNSALPPGSDIPGIRPGGPGPPGRRSPAWRTRLQTPRSGGSQVAPQGPRFLVCWAGIRRASLMVSLPGVARIRGLHVTCTWVCTHTLCECPRTSVFLTPVVKQAPGAALRVASARSPTAPRRLVPPPVPDVPSPCSCRQQPSCAP